ncbi:MAG: hypothetical protein OCD02_01010 [Spirochaetaceae bacterium]
MKKILLILSIILISFNIYSSGSNSARDEIYEDIDHWRNIGLIDRLPPIRPYPAQYLIFIFNEVIKRGGEIDVIKAQRYLESFTTMNLESTIKHNSYTDLEEYETISGFGLEANIPLHEYFTAGIDINVFMLNQIDMDTLAPTRSTGIDLNIDNMTIETGDITWDVLQSLNMNAGFGTDRLWFQSGMMSSSFGPLFSDSVVLNPNAKQAAHFSGTWIHDLFTASYLFMPIVATDNTGDEETDDKYIHIRSLDFKFTDFWEFQFYETVVYGGKGVKPIFFLPFNEFFYSAGQGGTWDVNSLLGLSSRFQFPQNISLYGTVYLDDINAIEVVKLNFDTRFKLAAQFNLDWSPEESVISTVNLTYTAIMPYMYTHITETPEDDAYLTDDQDFDIRSHALAEYLNYENYTNGGVSMGPTGMEPNSDKIGLNVTFNIPKGFKIKLTSEILRHGNSSSDEDRDYGDETLDADGNTIDTDNDGIADEAIPTDGTIFDPGYGWTGGYQYKNSTPFLTQDVIETLFLNEIVIVSPRVPLRSGEIYGELGYAFAYIENKDLVEGDDDYASYIRLSFNYSF